jgi:hypothetical protein
MPDASMVGSGSFSRFKNGGDHPLTAAIFHFQPTYLFL